MPLLKTRGASIYYERTGEGVPVLFIQGIGVTGEGWRPQVSELSRGYQTLTFDNRGIGRSRLESGEVTVPEMAADALAILDHLRCESAHVVGHSLGGMIAQEIALVSPQRAKSLTLMCTFARGRDGAKFRFWSTWMFFRTRVGTRPMRRRAFLEMLFPKRFLAATDCEKLAEQVGTLVGRDLATSPAVLMPQLRALGSYDRFEVLSRLGAIPTWVISAAFDPIAKAQFGNAELRKWFEST